ncbi:hypothetical protein ACJX0J_017309, partial [Zea mays]
KGRNGGAEYIYKEVMKGPKILIVTSIIIVQLLLGLNCAQPIEHNNSHVAWLLLLVFGSTILNEILGMLPLAYGLAYIYKHICGVWTLKFIIL